MRIVRLATALEAVTALLQLSAVEGFKSDVERVAVTSPTEA